MWILRSFLHMELSRIMQIPFHRTIHTRELKLMNPINLTEQRVSALSSSWLCTAKYDGTRTLYVVANFQGYLWKCTLTPRGELTILDKTEDEENDAVCYVLDCEQMHDRCVCHDVLVWDKCPVLFRDFSRRLKYIYKLRDPPFPGMPECKSFYPAANISMVDQSEGTDGIIFIHTCARFEVGKSQQVLKWKPLTAISIDLFVKSDGSLMMSDVGETSVRFTEPVCEFELPLVECLGNVVEFSYCDQGWFPYRIRYDKIRPNSSHVVKETISSIMQPVTYEQIVATCQKFH